ncbi:MAG: alpha/beta hydrolase family protein [Bryobacteraceae bacterium]
MPLLSRILCCAALAAAQQPAPKLKWQSRVEYGRAWEGVPEPYRKLPFPEMPIPATRAAWERKRPEIRKILHGCLGEMPPRPSPVRARTLQRERRDGYAVEKVEIENGVDAVIPAYLVIPDGLKRPAPAILLLHWHSGDKAGPLFSTESQNVLAPLVKRGFILLSIDSYFNGERLGKGPAGAVESNIDNQRDTLFKLNLWFGRTLWGMMLRDDMIAIDYLASRPEVDSRRIGASGMSMGSTGAWWLAALDDRVRAVAAVACFMRYRELVAFGQLRAHALYFFIPGMLRHFDTEAVLGLVAPRPLLALTGDSDPTSPPEGIHILEQKLGRIYGLYGAPEKFRSIVYPGVDHTYTPEMKSEMAAWFARWLRP